MSEGLWYADGLRFSCRRCGACCTGAPGFVWLAPEDGERIAALLGMEPQGFAARHTRRVLGGVSLCEEPGGNCVLFEAGRGCRAYEARPHQCRTWPFWARIVASPEAWEREAADCPGMGQGDLVGAEEIERLSRPAVSAGRRLGA